MVKMLSSYLRSVIEQLAARWLTFAVGLLRGKGYYGKYEKMYRLDLKEIPSFKLVAKLSKGRILDVGCGIGYLSFLFRNGYYGLDLNREALTIAKDSTGCEYIVGSAYALPLRSETFNTCVSYDSIEHFENIELALKEMKRIATSKVLVSTVDFNSYYRFLVYDTLHENEITSTELEAIAKRLFSAVRLFDVSGLFLAPRKVNEFLSRYFPNQIVLECSK